MSENGDEKDFLVDRAKNARASCKKCKDKCDKDTLRIAKLVTNYFSESGKMKHFYHIDCLFESFKKAKATTKKIETIDDLDGLEILTADEREMILEKIQDINGIVNSKVAGGSKKLFATTPNEQRNNNSVKTTSNYLKNYKSNSEDNLFKTFRAICDKIAGVSGYLHKSEILQQFLLKGSNSHKFQGNIYLWFKLLLPAAGSLVYNLQNKTIVKLFSRIYRTSLDDMLAELSGGDVSEVVRNYFTISKQLSQNIENTLRIEEIDEFLNGLSKLTKEDAQVEHFQKLCKKCNADDMKTVIRLIKHDLRINAGPRHILDALHPDAYKTFQTSRDLEMVIRKFAPLITENKINLDANNKCLNQGPSTSTSAVGSSSGVQLMSPISPMLAEACKSLDKAITKNPEGLYSEIKYDGERVQIHKSGNEFKFFSRNLKPVMEHKISQLKQFIPKAFPTGQDLILDSEIIAVNTMTGELLPFGTLGKHKQEQLTNSEVCLFIFDCIYYNGEDLTKIPLSDRKRILQENIKPIKYHVELSEYYFLRTKKELASMTAKVLKTGLEGLVLKNVKGLYQPGKRGWLKIKKDYLFEGQMADSADLVVLGAWFGTGKKGGLLSIFLMGCYDQKMKIWKTVTKAHSGLDDKTIDDFQGSMRNLMERCNADRPPPKWLACKKQLMPDYIAKDPMKMPVWEITGAEFTQTEVHTANGISIRFPRITKIRDDKSVEEATSLRELQVLLKKSKDHVNIDKLFKEIGGISDGDESNKDSLVPNIKTKFFDPINAKTTITDAGSLKKDILENSIANADDEMEEEEEEEQKQRATEESKEHKILKRKIHTITKCDDSDAESEKGEILKNLSKMKDIGIKRTITSNTKIEKDYDLSPKIGKIPKVEKLSNDGKGNATNDRRSSGSRSYKNSESEIHDKRLLLMFEKQKNDSIGKVVENDAKKNDKKILNLEEIFRGIVVFVLPAALEEFKVFRKHFKAFGGQITSESKDATHALHFEDINRCDFMDIREKYQAECRHITYKWVEECINQEKLVDPINYAVVL